MLFTLFTLAISPDQIVDTGSKIGTANNQVLLGIMLVAIAIALMAMIGVVIYLFKGQQKASTAQHEASTAQHEENKKAIQTLLDKLESREAAMTTERTARINMLLTQQKEDIEVKKDLSHAVINNTTAIGELKDFMKQQLEMQQSFLENLVKTMRA
jgi:uncharacterized protein HemX